MQKKLTKSEIKARLEELEELSYEKPQEEIIIGLDEILESDPDNVEALNFKAEMLLQLDRKEESYKISQKVLKLDKDNAEANKNVGSIKFNLKKIIKGTIKDKGDMIGIAMNIIVITSAIIISTCLSFYFQPQHESIICDSQYKCVIEHVFFRNYKKTEILQFSKNTIYKPTKETYYVYKHGTRGTSKTEKDGYMYHHAFSEQRQRYNIFKNSIHKYDEYEMQLMKKNETQRFENYKRNPSLQYHLQIKAQDRISSIGKYIETLLLLEYGLVLLGLLVWSNLSKRKKRKKCKKKVL